ncbi:hypothetical protein [Gelidibacter sp. F63206]|uniref:hypothetical protein n=1 Tax=Gelidibacter sp. F63206 TaxID=2926425 RepID=UPI001FF52654|nr:hypothetical protein [Gelidibacter sp. F63206]MCK0115079.1 hypothetical protein [Gelidibacter sp. F63206]
MSNQNVLIISPEPWGKSKISKHHYALALAEMGANVYFLNLNVQNKSSSDEICKDHTNIVLTNINISNYVNKFRFHFRFLYHVILPLKIKSWTKKHPKLDILISFDCNGVFTDLSLFKAKRTIFFPVDQVNVKYREAYKGFDELVSISPVILRAFPNFAPKKLLHHGLSPFFSQKDYQYKEVIKPKHIAYVGNLLIGPILDKLVIKKIVSNHSELQFHFYGAFQTANTNLGVDTSPDTYEFIDFLSESENCVLHGIVTPEELAAAYQNIDAFLVCYDYKHDKNECSNSHKIMEYLSTGKPIISTRISMYDNENLFPMLNTFDNSYFPEFFDQQMKDWDNISNISLFEKRKAFANKNSYEDNVLKILS